MPFVFNPAVITAIMGQSGKALYSPIQTHSSFDQRGLMLLGFAFRFTNQDHRGIPFSPFVQSMAVAIRKAQGLAYGYRISKVFGVPGVLACPRIRIYPTPESL